MGDSYRNASGSSSSSLNSSSHDTEDDHTIAEILAEEEKLRYDGKLGKRLSHLDSIPVCMIVTLMVDFEFLCFVIVVLLDYVVMELCILDLVAYDDWERQILFGVVHN